MMKEFIKLLFMATLAMMCFLSCTDTKKDMEEFLKKEIVTEFTNNGIDAAIVKNSLKLEPASESKFKGSVSVVIGYDTYDYELAVLIEGKTVKWQMEEIEASVKRRAQKQKERQRQEVQRQENERRRQEEVRAREEKARKEREEAQRMEEIAQRNEMERQARIYQDLQKIEEIKRQLPSLYLRWRVAVISNDYNSDVYYMNKVKDLRDKADRLYQGLSWYQSIDQQALYQDKRNFNDWCDNMLHQVTTARYNY